MGALASRSIIARHRPGVTANSSSVHDIVGREGGVAPRPRRRSQRVALALAEREEISRVAGSRSPVARHQSRPPACAVDD